MSEVPLYFGSLTTFILDSHMETELELIHKKEKAVVPTAFRNN